MVNKLNNNTIHGTSQCRMNGSTKSSESDHEIVSLAMDLSAARTAVYYSTYPIFYLLNFILFILAIITAPLLHLGSFCLYAYWYALHILSKFEASHVKPGMVDKCFMGH